MKKIMTIILVLLSCTIISVNTLAETSKERPEKDPETKKRILKELTDKQDGIEDYHEKGKAAIEKAKKVAKEGIKKEKPYMSYIRKLQGMFGEHEICFEALEDNAETVRMLYYYKDSQEIEIGDLKIKLSLRNIIDISITSYGNFPVSVAGIECKGKTKYISLNYVSQMSKIQYRIINGEHPLLCIRLRTDGKGVNSNPYSLISFHPDHFSGEIGQVSEIVGTKLIKYFDLFRDLKYLDWQNVPRIPIYYEISEGKLIPDIECHQFEYENRIKAIDARLKVLKEQSTEDDGKKVLGQILEKYMLSMILKTQGWNTLINDIEMLSKEEYIFSRGESVKVETLVNDIKNHRYYGRRMLSRIRNKRVLGDENEILTHLSALPDVDFIIDEKYGRIFIRKIEYDFNNDGVKDIAVVSPMSCGNAGCQWGIYLGVPGGYKYHSTMFFSPGALSVRPILKGMTKMYGYHHMSASDGFEWEIEFSDVEVVRKHSIEVTWSDHEGDLPSSGKPSFRDLVYTAPVKDYLERGELNWEKGY